MQEIVFDKIRARVKEIREIKCGDNIKRFAALLHVPYTSYKAYEDGVIKKFSPELLLALKSKLNVSIDWLLTGEDAGTQRPVNAVEYRTLKEKEYLEKLLRVIRSGDTPQTTMTILDAVLTSKSEAESPPARPCKSKTGTR